MPNQVTPIPPGFHSVTVHLNVKGATAYIDFLKKAFNAVEMHRSPGPGGKLMHATVKIGDSMVMFADDFSEEFHMPPFVTGNLPFVINLYVPDADAAWAQALAAGCEVKFPLANQFWGDRYGQVRDPFGFTWAITTRIEEVTPKEMQERSAKMMGGGHS
jgi:PhnB protein